MLAIDRFAAQPWKPQIERELAGVAGQLAGSRHTAKTTLRRRTPSAPLHHHDRGCTGSLGSSDGQRNRGPRRTSCKVPHKGMFAVRSKSVAFGHRCSGRVLRSWAPPHVLLRRVVCVCQADSAFYPTESYAQTDRPGSVRDLTSSLFIVTELLL